MAIDPGLAAIVSTAALASTGTINKLLGPTAEYFGKELGSFAKKRTENIGRIFQKAIKKLGSKIDEPGQVHPKLLKSLILDGSFCDDELTAEYYGGVLASSRSGISRDDRGTTYLGQISSLSCYQIRTHFILHTVLKKLSQNSDVDMSSCTETNREIRFFIPSSEYKCAMSFSENNEDMMLFMNHAFTGLERSKLIRFILMGKTDKLEKRYAPLKFPVHGFVCQPSRPGLELFLWSTGHGDMGIHSFMNSDIKIEVPEGIVIPTNAFLLQKELQRQQEESQQSNP